MHTKEDGHKYAALKARVLLELYVINISIQMLGRQLGIKYINKYESLWHEANSMCFFVHMY